MKSTNSRPSRIITLGWQQNIVVLLGVLIVLLAMGIALYPSLQIQYIQEFGIRPFEAEYGFRTGDVLVRRDGASPETTWGIVWVAPDGKFSALGIRAGDVPFAYHGGVVDMYAALQIAAGGEPSSFEVFNAAEASQGRAALRTINVP